MNLIDVYLCYNPIEAANARDILEQDGFEVTVHNLNSTAFPVVDDANARITIQVLADRAVAARDSLRQAVEAEVIQGEGHVVEPDDED